MMPLVVAKVAPLAQRLEVRFSVVRRVLIEMSHGQDHPRPSDGMLTAVTGKAAVLAWNAPGDVLNIMIMAALAPALAAVERPILANEPADERPFSGILSAVFRFDRHYSAHSILVAIMTLPL